jgi:hypothetical protein
MNGRTICYIVAAALMMWAFAVRGQSHTLYAASVRSGGTNADIPIAGNLYTVNLANGQAALIGAIRLSGGKAIGVTGMAFHPQTNVLYGITSAQSPNVPNSLVTIDANSGVATLVGELRTVGSDLSFDAKGVLYVWMQTTSQLGMVDISTAKVTPVGKPGPQGAAAGIAVDPQGMVYVTAKGASGTLDNVDLASGGLQQGPPLTGAPFSTQINSMSFSPSGLLLAVNSNGGSPAITKLVTINTATGAVSTIGGLPDDTDALAFLGNGPNLAPTFSGMSPGGKVVVIVLTIVLLFTAGTVIFKRQGDAPLASAPPPGTEA